MKRWLSKVPRADAFFWKLYGTYVGVVLVSTAVVSMVAFQFFASNTRDAMRSHMAQLANLLASLEAANPQELWSSVAQNRVEELAASSGTQIDIVLADGTVKASTRHPLNEPSRLLELPEFLEARRSGSGESVRADAGEELDSLHLVRAISIRSESIGFVRISKSMAHLMAEFKRLGLQIALGAMLAAGVSLVGGVYFGRTVTKPLGVIAEGCMRIARGDRSQLIDLRRSDEFGIVARTVNEMAASLTRQLRQIELQKNRSELVLRLLQDAVVAIDGDGRIALMNAAAEDYCRCGDVASCLGIGYEEAFAVEAIVSAIGQRREGDGEKEHQLQWTDDCGQKRHASMFLSPLRAEEHDLAGLLVVIRDMTEQRRFESLRRDFASNVSHELKTPITAIAALIDALSSGAAEDRGLRESFLQRIRLQNQRMKRLVDELLALSKLESGKGMLERKSCDLRESLNWARETFAQLAAHRGVKFEVEIPERPVMLKGDLKALEVMVNSLVDNALKFTDKGGRIALALTSRKGLASIEVEDTGCGIPAEHRDRIFERFYRIDASRARDRGGSGLGLAIVKHMAIAHGGEVRLESEEGKGSRFTVTLPLLCGEASGSGEWSAREGAV